MKIKKLCLSIVLIILIFFNLAKPVQANIFTDDLFEDDNKSDVEEVIDEDDGGLFEKIIAKMIRRHSRNSF